MTRNAEKYWLARNARTFLKVAILRDFLTLCISFDFEKKTATVFNLICEPQNSWFCKLLVPKIRNHLKRNWFRKTKGGRSDDIWMKTNKKKGILYDKTCWLLLLCYCAGLFNFNRKTWSIYTQNPKTSMPVVTLPMTFK